MRKACRAVFLDRDGVLNEAIVRNGRPHPPDNLEQLRVFEDATSACARLKEHGFVLAVVTNQPDVARGTQRREVVEAINRKISETVDVDEFFVCYHDNKDGCRCRKPGTGLLEQAAAKFNINLQRSFMVGDRWRDVECGRSAGCRTVFIDWRSRGYTEALTVQPDYIARSLLESTEWILSRE